MGRTIIADNRVLPVIEQLYISEDWVIGLIIGQQTSQRDYVIHLIKTPSKLEEEEEEKHSKQARVKNKETLDTLDELWVVTHAKQVLKMLPGGLDIIGMFAVAAPALMTASQFKLKQVLLSIAKMTSRAGSWSKCESDTTERIILQLCSVTRRITCRTHDVADGKGIAKPADLKFQSFLSKWNTISCTVAPDIKFHIPSTIICQSLLKQIQKCLSVYCQNIWNAVVRIDNKILKEDSALDTTASEIGGSKKDRKHRAESAVGKTFQAEIYAELKGALGDDGATKAKEHGGLLVLKGSMCCRAYVHSKATYLEAVNAMKRDVIRSLMSRCELLCEDFAAQEEENYPRVLLETPKRIFAAVGDSNVCLCDYAFPDERPFESKERFADLVDLHLSESDLQTDCERLPDNEELIEAEKIPEKDHNRVNFKKKSMQRNYIGGMIAAVVATVAAGISYIYLPD